MDISALRVSAGARSAGGLLYRSVAYRSTPLRANIPRTAAWRRAAARRQASPSKGIALDTAPALDPPAAPAALLPFAPVAENQRIEALDVVRGFALLGIFLMNIEWFNRPLTTFNEGMPRGLKGADWLASWFIAYFVQGKFWTIFSLLFGMGFAVMLVRAERAGREFTKVYLRRILALAVFGAVHYIYVWEGDILFSYAMGALALLIILYGRAWPIVIGCATLVGLGVVADSDLFFRGAGGLAAAGGLALYLRGNRRIAWRGRSIPAASFLLLLVGIGLSIAAVVLWLLPDGPIEPRAPLSAFGPLLLVMAWLSWKFRDPLEKRSLRLAVGLYVFGAVAMTAVGLVQQLTPDPLAVLGAAGPSAATVAGPATVGAARMGASSAAVAAPTAKKTRLERAAELKAEREKHLAELATKKAEEINVFTHGSYLDTVMLRAREFPEKVANDAGFAVLLSSMFLLGVWFVRSGVMENTAQHLDFFRKLALFGLPVGIGVGVVSGFIAMSHTPGDRYDGWQIARGLLLLGNLPACLGYVGLVVTMLHSRSAWSRVRVLAPLGRMALTNYLMQSLICMLFFYGFALGHWGMPRAEQVVFVALVYAAQIAFSHWWLARFRYGPMEWLWRGFTYGKVPPLRNAATAAATASPAE